MKYVILTLLVFITNLSFSQSPKFQTYSAQIEVIATKDGTDHTWKNSNILVNLNYKTGALNITLKNSDFRENQNEFDKLSDEAGEEREYLLKGILPINEILNQKPSTQNYTVELQLTNEDIDFSTEIIFQMSVMRTSQNSGSYRVFTLTGTLYNDEVNLPAFKGYDSEVDLRIFFNAFWNQ